MFFGYVQEVVVVVVVDDDDDDDGDDDLTPFFGIGKLENDGEYYS